MSLVYKGYQYDQNNCSFHNIFLIQMFSFSISLVKYVEKIPEPLSADYQRDNPWTTGPVRSSSSGGCCSVQ